MLVVDGEAATSACIYYQPYLHASPLPCNGFLVVIGEVLPCTCCPPRTARYT
ncbi:hypothetical protein E2C01_076344 [Portunus trituberculatus]|uniref:Uncharacterized protein n=1 Tax=Portunus trituberculatus TaxID=210409 RepID=A0A5B7IHG0_PORTR|nr:hypothetical protein [Portunus trituberculatus]